MSLIHMTEKLFLFFFKSKYRRKVYMWKLIIFSMPFFYVSSIVYGKCNSTLCAKTGMCKNDTCVCYDGWQGSYCQFCGGKVRLGTPTGIIYDGVGNYSLSSKCSWLIYAPNSTITLHVEEFSTECGWDHLYVFDGDSVESPLLAVFSGVMYKNSYSLRRIPEIVAQSGSALIHFFSDDANNMSGFNLTYRINACPSMASGIDCSGNGICIEGTCTCNGGWGGIACHLENCPNNCGAVEERGVCEPERGCSCFGNYRGHDCSQIATGGYWETVTVQGFVPPGCASHGAAVWRDSMYIIAGESYNQGSLLFVYDFNGHVWETPHIEEGPPMRYGHSTVIYGDKIFLYGGVLGNRGPTSELWAFDISAKTWENITVKAASCNNGYLMCGPIKLAGHSSTIVINNISQKADRMVIIFGHSPDLGYLNTVQEYYFGTREWYIINTKGYPVKGGYGHSASWDPLTGKIYVYGGIISEGESVQFISKNLYSYEPNERIWMLLADAPSARFLHTATFISEGLLFVFGGNTHNDSSHSTEAKCYSSEMLTYDVLCDTWNTITTPKDINVDLARYGHSAVVFEGSLYIYGGFDGQMLTDIIKYTPGNCDSINETSCLNVDSGVKCIWESKTGSCTSISRFSKDIVFKKEDNYLNHCLKLNRTAATKSLIYNSKKCESMKNCVSCIQTTSECVWCGNFCTLNKKCYRINDEASGLNPIYKADYCPMDPIPICKQLHTCKACTSQPFCRWRLEHSKCVADILKSNISVDAIEPMQCQNVCAEYNSCSNCTQQECIWCQNEGRCVDKNAYTPSFPYGQCREWTTVGAQCRSKETKSNSPCNYYKTCAKCRDDPACGWCDDGSKTGIGVCIPGGYAGPTLHTQSLPSSTCPSERWHFTTCPVCQCNGHGSCFGNSSKCMACNALTTGSHCEHCIKAYWGNPVNGGKCIQCNCNKQAFDCHRETGKCYCTTKGIIGDQCEKCDSTNHYHADLNNKSCYYDLTIDYQFTFNLSKKEDRHYTQINFRNSPIKSDIDADFLITCSVPAKMNITLRKGSSVEEKPIHMNFNCTTFRWRFSKSDYNFGVEENTTLTTFYVYVYDFEAPLWIQISFSQYPKLNLQQFFITFSSCFLILLLVAAILWKVKQRYDMYRRRQRLFVEMEQMASRPFSQVLVELEFNNLRIQQSAPSPIALEPCYGNRAAVLTLLTRLPTCGEPYITNGQSTGLAIASALVSLGNPRKLSIDTIKSDIKGSKLRKVLSQHPDSGYV